MLPRGWRFCATVLFSQNKKRQTWVRLTEYRMHTDTNCIILYSAMYLKTPNDVVKAALPSLQANCFHELAWCKMFTQCVFLSTKSSHIFTTGKKVLKHTLQNLTRFVTNVRRNLNISTQHKIDSKKPSNLMTVGTHSMLGCLEVNGEATEASASDSEIPACAVFSAPQSFAPSPHIPTQYLQNKAAVRGFFVPKYAP